MSKTNTELLQKAVSSLEMLDAENIDSSKLNDLISSIENLSPSISNGPTLSVSEKEDGSYHLDGKDVEKSFDDFNKKIAAERKKLGKVIVIDTETTGLSPRYDELLQRRLEWAKKNGVSVDAVQSILQTLHNECVSVQL